MQRSAILDDRAVLIVAGEQAAEFLQGLITNDMARLETKTAIYAGLLTPQGKLLFDFFIVRAGEREFLIDCAKTRSAELVKRLKLYRLRSKVEIAETDLVVRAVWGESEPAPLPRARAFYLDPRLPELGFRVIAPREILEHALSAEIGAYHAHRILLGVPDSADLPPDTAFALDAGFEELNGVSFKKGCYVGQEVTSRMKHRASARKRFFIASAAKPLMAGAALVADGREVGVIASGTPAASLALVRLDRVAEAKQADLPITADGVPVALAPPPWLKIPSSDGVERQNE